MGGHSTVHGDIINEVVKSHLSHLKYSLSSKLKQTKFWCLSCGLNLLHVSGAQCWCLAFLTQELFSSFHQDLNESVETSTRHWLRAEECTLLPYRGITGVMRLERWLERSQFVSLGCLGKCECGNWCNTFSCFNTYHCTAGKDEGWSPHCSGGWLW